MYRTNTCGELTKDQIDQEVTLAGWVHSRRDHGGVIFIDLRDHYGITQVKVNPDKKEAFKVADSARSEYVLQITGKVIPRPDDMVNSKLKTGEIN